MTPTQSKQAAAIMLKHGEDGWRIEYRDRARWVPVAGNALWYWLDQPYRAVRIERIPTRTPLPIEHYRRGMEVMIANQSCAFLIMGVNRDKGYASVMLDCDTAPNFYDWQRITAWRWPNETEWKPAYTETIEEREVARLEVEGL